jgi:hypothetical protein
MKISAEDLWPLILDFVENFYGEEDLAHFKDYFKLKNIKHQVLYSAFLLIMLE